MEIIMSRNHLRVLSDVLVAVASEAFPTLVAAVQAAGMVDVLNSDGPVTVFAPTEEAFSAALATT